MANWTPEVFVGKMFQVFKTHLPLPPAGVPSPMLWGDEKNVRERLKAFTEVKLTRRIAVFNYPFPPAETVEFFRRYYGPTGRAFDVLSPNGQGALHRDLVDLQTANNSTKSPNLTETTSEYMEVIAVRGAK